MRFRLDRLYPITNSANPHGLDHVEVARLFLKSGVRFFQVREKTLADLVFSEQLRQIRDLCDGENAQFIVNDRVDLALAVRADGVHLGQGDLPVAEARRILGHEAVLGLSTHNRLQFEKAQYDEIDYVAIGPVLRTSTKQSPHPPLGVDTVIELAARSQHPVVAIGGITLESAQQLWQSGVHSVAVISDILGRADPEGRLSEYMTLVKETHE